MCNGTETVNINAETIGVRLPNGEVSVMKSSNPSDINKKYKSDEEFLKAHPNKVDEATGKETVSTLLLDMINE